MSEKADCCKYEEELAVLSLDERGMICDCSAAVAEVSGYLPGELLGRHVSFLLPGLPESILVEGGQINPRISFLCHCEHLFHIKDSNGRMLPSQLHLFELNNPNGSPFRMILLPLQLKIEEH